MAARSLTVVDLSEQEQAAIRTAMRPVGEIFEEIGWDTKLADISEAQVLTLIEVAIGGFQDAMRETARICDQEIPF